MAINKDRNHNLQITISNSDFDKLLTIQQELSALLSIELNKSQVIAFLIKNYGKTATNSTKSQTTAPNRTIKNNVNYQAQVIALKDNVNVSWPRLSQLIGIPETTLKKYARAIQQPQGQNLELLNQALKRYGIK